MTRDGPFACCASQCLLPPDNLPIAHSRLTGNAPLRRAYHEIAMQIYYLEIVTKNVDAVCAVYAAANGVAFGEADAALGNARTAALSGGGLVGVRAPLRESEEPVIRPYWLVDNIESAVAAAADAGAMIALPPMEISGHGICAIYIAGGVEHGLWQR